nr:response regulator [Desulfobaculum xiamenense]
MRALVVEDDFVSREVLRKHLAPFFDVNIVVNGEEAVSAFRMASEERRPYNLVVMDIMMPVLDGLSALKRIREFEAERDLDPVTVIMATALSDPKTVMQSFNGCAAAGYIVKPYDGEKIRDQLVRAGFIFE